MEKLDSLTPDLTQENIDRIAALFPECVTEAENESGGGFSEGDRLRCAS